jgi:two-component system chemotaxis response regulator CheB
MSVLAPTAPNSPTVVKDAIRVMVVDDAVVVRTLLSRWVDEAPDLKLVAALRNGREAVDQFAQHDPDVVLLDVDMPELDGISTLPLLFEKKRDLTVIMVSALTRDNAEVTLRALSLGAADYIPKPVTEGGVITASSFQRELIEKIRVLGARRQRHALPHIPSPRIATAATHRLAGAVQRVARWQTPNTAEHEGYALRSFSPITPRVLVIGASTGGPQALNKLVARLETVTDAAPVLITQHMPATFTTILAEHLARASGKPAREAVDGEPVLAGTIYLAPGGRHMKVARRNGTAVIVIDDGPQVNFCKPAVDPLFASAAEVWGTWNLAVVLTGMGTDGRKGAADIVAAGGSVIAQDEATSTIWGMPGAVAGAGLCSAVLPIDQIAPKVVRLFMGVRS